MAHSTLYRKYRPTGWDTVIGQGHIVTTLKNQIEYGMIGHAYLFTGTRGTGKTTSAKIFARAVNCATPNNGSPCGKCSVCLALQNPTNMDIIEMDAASNNGVDEIRDLRESIQYPPTIGKYKVYIIDEVHMLTTSAFNALLKTLEEPPAHAMFILATTEVHKLPQTILSRCMRFDFRLVAVDELVSLLSRIFKDMQYEADSRSLELIATHGEGSVRDTLSLAETCISYAPQKLTYQDVSEVLGISDFETISSMADAMLSGNLSELLYIMNNIYKRGKGITTINKELTTFLRDSLAIKNIQEYKAAFTEIEYPIVKTMVDNYDNYRIGRAMDILAGAENLVKYSTQPKIVFEACLVKASELYLEADNAALLSRVRSLEKELAKLKTEGVIVKSNTSAAKASPANIPTVSLDDELAKLVTEEDSVPIFDESDIQVASEQQHMDEKFSLILRELQSAGDFLIHHVIKDLPISQVSMIDDNTINVALTDPAMKTMFNHRINVEAIQKCVHSALGDSVTITFNDTQSKQANKAIDHATINQLFGSQLKK